MESVWQIGIRKLLLSAVHVIVKRAFRCILEDRSCDGSRTEGSWERADTEWWWAVNKRHSSCLAEQVVRHCYTCNNACRDIVAFSGLTVHLCEGNGTHPLSPYNNKTASFRDEQMSTGTGLDSVEDIWEQSAENVCTKERGSNRRTEKIHN